MKYQITVSDHAHGGGQIIVHQRTVRVPNQSQLHAIMFWLIGDYPFCRADPV